MIVVDLYAGVGIAQAVRRLGHEELGVENEPAAIAIREANGFRTVYEDVWNADNLQAILEALDLYASGQWTLWASPPCQPWSNAGKGAARAHRESIIAAMHRGIYRDIDELREFGRSLGDENYVHVLVPLHYIFRYRPTFVAFEQVPPVLSLWQEMVPVLESMGYSAKAANLSAEQYGVPQTRKRAILVARNDGVEVQLPTPTHSKFYPRTPEKLDPGVNPWVSMAEGLSGIGSWPLTRPAPTVTGGGTRTGGAEPFGPGGRRAIARARDAQ